MTPLLLPCKHEASSALSVLRRLLKVSKTLQKLGDMPLEYGFQSVLKTSFSLPYFPDMRSSPIPQRLDENIQ